VTCLVFQAINKRQKAHCVPADFLLLLGRKASMPNGHKLGHGQDVKSDKDFQTSVRQAVSLTFSARIKLLDEAVKEVDQEMLAREQISRRILREIDSEIVVLEQQLQEISHWQIGQNESVDARRLGLEREILAHKRERRDEIVRRWQDLSALVRRRRDLIMEREELRNLEKMLAP